MKKYLLLGALALCASLCAFGQSTQVVTIGTPTAQQVSQGLGFNIDDDEDWEFAAAYAAGARNVRFQCSWSGVEQQTAPPNNTAATTQYVEDSGCTAGFASAKARGMKVTVTAGYGPPFHPIVDVILTITVPTGATSLPVTLLDSFGGDTLSSIAYPYAYICPALMDSNGNPTGCYANMTGRTSGPGSLIANVTVSGSTATLGLASATTSSLSPSVVSLTCSATGQTLTCPNGGLTSAMVQNRILIPGGGRSGASFTTAISSVSSSTSASLIGGVTEAVSAETVTVTQVYVVNQILYPSTNNYSPTDASIVAYGNYASFLASDMASSGVTGSVEIWNEPPWPSDAWDYRAYLYDSAPGVAAYSSSATYALGGYALENGNVYKSLIASNTGHDPATSTADWTATPNVYPGTLPAGPSGANFGFAANIMSRTFPTGVTATWNGTSGSANASLMGTYLASYTGDSLVEPSPTITTESFHPYSGNYANPEDSLFLSACLTAEVTAGTQANCQLPGQAGTANLWLQRWESLTQQAINSTYGLGADITETNELPPSSGLQTQQARAIMRQFIGFVADGLTPVDFYKFYVGNADPGFSFVTSTGTDTYTARPQYTALSGYMADVNLIANAPVTSYTASSLPSVTSYSGTYALAVAHAVGARSSATANSDLLTVWQVSACTTASTCWYSLASPSAAPVSVTLPVGSNVTKVWDTVAQTAVSYTSTGSTSTGLTVSFDAADNPIEVLVDPVAGSVVTPLCPALGFCGIYGMNGRQP